jgi:hypothetical protein
MLGLFKPLRGNIMAMSPLKHHSYVQECERLSGEELINRAKLHKEEIIANNKKMEELYEEMKQLEVNNAIAQERMDIEIDVRMLKQARPLPRYTEKNQCDGCRQKLPLNDAGHHIKDGLSWIACTKSRYEYVIVEEEKK